jgi:hypothetical protein
MKNKMNIAAAVLSLSLVFALYGCGAIVAGGAAAGATYVYTEGWVERNYNAGLDTSYNAAMEAVKDMDMTIVENTKDVGSAEIKSQKCDQDYWIKMDMKGKNLTAISVRAGLTGDKQASERIHEQIQEAL